MTDFVLTSFALHQADAHLEAYAQVVEELGLAGIYLIFGLFLPSLFRNNSMLLVLGLLAATIVFLVQELHCRSIGGAGL
jgi:hypothetical protein